MNKKDLLAILERLFPHPKMPLHYEDPFTLLIATMLSAQTTDQRVNEITPFLFSLARTPQQMASCSIQDIETIIRPLGLAPTKAKNIKKIAIILRDDYHEKVPSTFAKLEALPGIGHKTASVVLMYAFDIPTFPVDTHIFRSARRWGLSRGKTPLQVEKDLQQLFPKNQWKKIHLQMLFFARKYCPARGHQKEKCPICRNIK
ncbi:MAG: endonuclease III [Parachlamydiales bacterium]|nr:endonuclease III [Parachlamydiales bacterium]